MRRSPLHPTSARPTMHRWIFAALLAGVPITGCDEGDASTQSQAPAGDAVTPASTALATAVDAKDDPNDLSVFDPRVAKATSLARAIEARPLEADEALDEAGSSREELERLMYEIAIDPDLSEQYRIARSG